MLLTGTKDELAVVKESLSKEALLRETASAATMFLMKTSERLVQR